MANYDNDVLGVGNPEHPANQEERDCMTFDEAMASLSDKQKEAIEEELIDRNIQVDSYTRMFVNMCTNWYKAQALMQEIETAKSIMNNQVVEQWGNPNPVNKTEWNKAYFTVQQKEEELKKLLLG